MDRSTRRRYRPAIAFAALVLVVSLLPAPETGGPAPELLGIALDKWVHAGSYAALTGLLAWGHGSRAMAAVALVAALAVGYGVGIEFLQGFVPSRTLSGADALANTVGAVGGGALWLTLTARVGALDADDRA
ncbi:VanZ family protein [Haloarcula onubensis]|uniref:VanZ family protein n=1 Tax=Haloarcula onubensis TaxID=2950539 RepID=A0ABU2FS68_9EURY|nr:VanZ family protein [Halomicroarcula sp. S3CR25-11]MDS0283610.1 VanZ family protein [Halomicroarcula sp. S3CR25-11]